MDMQSLQTWARKTAQKGRALARPALRSRAFRIALFIAVLLAVFFYAAYRLSQQDLFGWRFNFSIAKVETNNYESVAPNLSFRYPRTFEIDRDEKKRYGAGYIVGVKLKTDDRTGCDIRRGGPSLDYSRSVDEMAETVVGPIRERASDFRLIEKDKMAVGGRPALKVDFSFLDPIGSRVRLDQIFVDNQGTQYMIICGTGEYQHAFFVKDFRMLYDTLRFESKVLEDRSGWRGLMFWK
jgi:hypothetical protein